MLYLTFLAFNLRMFSVYASLEAVNFEVFV